MFFQKKKLLEKAVAMKNFEHPLLGRELKKQISILEI